MKRERTPEFIELLRTKQPELNIEKLIEIAEIQFAAIINRDSTEEPRLPIGCDLYVNVIANIVGEYIKATEDSIIPIKGDFAIIKEGNDFKVLKTPGFRFHIFPEPTAEFDRSSYAYVIVDHLGTEVATHGNYETFEEAADAAELTINELDA